MRFLMPRVSCQIFYVYASRARRKRYACRDECAILFYERALCAGAMLIYAWVRDAIMMARWERLFYYYAYFIISSHHLRYWFSFSSSSRHWLIFFAFFLHFFLFSYYYYSSCYYIHIYFMLFHFHWLYIILLSFFFHILLLHGLSSLSLPCYYAHYSFTIISFFIILRHVPHASSLYMPLCYITAIDITIIYCFACLLILLVLFIMPLIIASSLLHFSPFSRCLSCRLRYYSLSLPDISRHHIILHFISTSHIIFPAMILCCWDSAMPIVTRHYRCSLRLRYIMRDSAAGLLHFFRFGFFSPRYSTLLCWLYAEDRTYAAYEESLLRYFSYIVHYVVWFSCALCCYVLIHFFFAIHILSSLRYEPLRLRWYIFHDITLCFTLFR